MMNFDGDAEIQTASAGILPGSAEDRDQFLWVQAELGIVTWVWESGTAEIRWWGDLSPLVGLAPGKFSGTLAEYLRFLHPDDAESARRTFRLCIEGRRPSYRSEHRVVWADGTVRWLETYGRAQYSPSGEARRVMGVVKDSSDRKSIESALLQSEERFAKVFRASPAAISVTRLSDGLILNVNPYFEEITAYRTSEVVGRTTMEIDMWVDPEVRDKWVRSLTERGHVRDFPARFRTKHGGVISVLLSSQRLDLDGEEGAISLAQDVTEREQTERIALESQKKYAAVFEISPEALAVTRAEDGAIVEVNSAFILQLGRSREATLGRSGEAIGVWARASDREQVLTQLRNEGRVSNFETQFLHADGSPRDILLSCSRVQFDQHPCIVWSWRNITDIRTQERSRAESERRHREDLLRLANEDPLTRLPNRNWFMEHLSKSVDAARAGQYQFAVLFVDFDGFKRINDSIGHAIGDELLKVASRRLEETLLPLDRVARIGGDEFTVLTGCIENESNALAAASRMVQAFSRPFSISSYELSIGISIGISLYPKDGLDGDQLLRSADIAMYEAKANGRGRYHFYTDALYQRLTERMETERALTEALQNGEFVLHYQPRISAADGKLLALEALIRWDRPRHGLVYPYRFIQLAEETGLIIRIGQQVIEMACAQLAAWKEQGLAVVPISLNVSPQEFQRAEFINCIRETLARYAIGPDFLEVEITESSTLDANFNVQRRLGELHALGSKVLIDDFGTGYSSLSQLQKLDVDVLKIDQSFTAELCNSAHGEVLVRAIIEMAKALGMVVVAEGVETIEQFNVLRRLGCDEVQGYLISRPVDAKQVAALFGKVLLP